MSRIVLTLLLSVTGQPAAEPTPCWIWAEKEAVPNQTVLFRKSFTVPGDIKSAKLYATCDDVMWAYVNGREMLRNETWQTPAYADVTDAVKKGANVLAIRGRNQQSNIAALLAKLVITTKDNKKHVIVTDGTWQTAKKGRKGWKALAFNAKGWTDAVVVGKLGDGPWTSVNRKSLAAAARRLPAQATYNKLRAVKGFKVEQIYTVPKAQGSWVSMTTDPQGRLIVSDQYGKLYRVTPGNDASVNVEPIPVALGEAQGLLWAFDSLYVVVNRGGKYASGMYRVRDTNGDDILDKVEQLRPLQGGGEHGPHAVMLSPDKKSLFVVCGNHTNLTKLASSRVPRIWGEDSLLPRMWDANGHARGRMAPAGCIYNVSPDGSQWTLWCCGFRNEYDAAFNREGELFTYDSDMEWDMNTPWYRPTRVCHCVSGADFGWRGGTAKFPTFYPDNLPAVVDIGPGSPTGVAFGYGAKFPAKYQNALYLCDWSYGKLYAVHMTPQGATYKGTLEEFITGTPLPLTDIVVNPKDGAMYFAVGGRRVKSALYRVTYTGDKATTPASDSKKNLELRQLRRKLERYHGKSDPKTVAAVWPYLKHEDRFIRWAARTALEHQDVAGWRTKALQEKNPQAALESLLALVRKSKDKASLSPVLDALGRLQWQKLDEMQKQALLRVHSLAFVRLRAPTEKEAEQLAARFDPHFPSKSVELNDELCKLLVYLEAPSAATKGLALMRNAVTQEEQMALALSLRNLKTGWTLEQRKEYYRWFPRALGYKGGHSFHGFVRNIRSEAIAHLGQGEKQTLGPILNAKPIEKPNPLLTTPRKFVKEWKVNEVLKVIDKHGLKKRNFNQGRRMFAATRCFACHRFANEGGAFGPDLTGLSGRFTPRDLVESIIDPSKSVSDQYQAVTIVTNGGKIYNGRIINLAGDSLRVNTDMFNPDKLVSVNRRQIAEILPSKLSMMPTGLINTLNDEEVLDLMAYLLSRGDRNHAMFRRD